MASGMATASYELRFDSGRICLDLLATTHPEERLDSVDRLRAWITRSGLVPAGTPLPAADISWLVGFRELRGHVARLVRGELDARPADAALARVNAVALAAPPAPWAVRADDGSLRRRLHTPPGRPGCSPSSPATPSNCSPTRWRARASDSARGTTARSSTSTPPGGGAGGGAPARCAETGSGWPGIGAGRPSPAREPCWTRVNRL